MKRTILYDKNAHHSKHAGYQNVKTAKAFARYVKRTLSAQFPDFENKRVGIYGVDNSTCYLAAHVKMLLPDIEFISGKKADNDKNDDYTGMSVNYASMPDILLFVDDYFSSGRVSGQFAYCMQHKSNFSSECEPDMVFFFIKAAYSEESIKIRLKDINSKYPIHVNVMVK